MVHESGQLTDKENCVFNQQIYGIDRIYVYALV